MSARIDVVTIFPEFFEGFLNSGIAALARERRKTEIGVHNLRDYSDDPRQVDDTPYGGGPGMVMKAPPYFEAVKSLKAGGIYKEPHIKPRVILPAPQGRIIDHSLVKDFGKSPWLIILCGRYEGVDHRVEKYLATDVVSIGDFILGGGEVVAMAICEAVLRLQEGVLGCAESSKEESFASGLLEYPQYTRPSVLDGQAVPEILLSGDHKNIKRWRRERSLEITLQRRPDLLETAQLTESDYAFLEELGWRKRR